VNRQPIPPSIASIEKPIDKLWTFYILKAIASNVAIFITLPLFYFRFHTMRYKFDEDGIHMRWGILVRREIMLNYSRIQDIHLQSNIIERWLGLARIEVQTASGGSDTEMTLEGIPDPAAMRDFLYSRMRGVHSGETATTQDPVAAALHEVADELRLIREELVRRNG
jgi:putative membrane protein